jgi:hypothetical protein
MANTITPKTINYLTGEITNFAQATTDHGVTATPLASAVLGPAMLKNEDGTFTSYAAGLLAVMYSYTTIDEALDSTLHLTVEVFDLLTKQRVSSLAVDEISQVNPSGFILPTDCGVSVIQLSGNHWGYLYHVSDPSGVISGAQLRLVRWGFFSDGAGGAAWQKKSSSVGAAMGAHTTDMITDVAALPWSLGVDFIVARGQVDTGAGEKHLYFCITNLNQSYSAPSEGDTFTKILDKAFASDEWDGWYPAAVPDTVLALQVMSGAHPSQGNIAALIGDYVDATWHKAITNPKLAVLCGPAQSGNQRNEAGAAVAPLGVLESMTGAFGPRAHGLVTDQFGYIYTCGTGGLSATNDHLVEKWKSWDLAAGPVAFVDHADAANGDLGGDYAAAADTHVHSPIWTGRHLIVVDHSPTRTVMKVYSRDLEYVTSVTLATSAETRRWFGDKAAAIWHAGNH